MTPTNGISSWAVDFGSVEGIYPFPGSEPYMFAAAVAFWVGWHVLQFRSEQKEIAKVTASETNPETIRASIRRF